MKWSDMKKYLTGAALAGATALAFGMDIKFPTPVFGKQEAATKVEAPVSNPIASTTALPPAAPDLKQLNDAFTNLAQTVSPAVVNIYTKSGGSKTQRKAQLPPGLEDQFEFYFGGPFPGQNQPREALGSGFVISEKDGYIVTNAHVVRMAGQDADEIMIKFIGEENGHGHKAKVVGVDEVTDVALLKLVEKKEGLKAVVFGDSDHAKVGEWVMAIGNPYGHTHTVTQGIVSAVGRNLPGARADFVQTSASINPGNSGGPLINIHGEVIGINAAIDPRAQGIGFAIPSNVAKEVVTQLANQGRVSRPWMGIAIQDIDEDAAGMLRLKKPEGVLVQDVMENDPAAKAGMEKFDVITKINGKEVANTKDLFKVLEKLPIGKTANIEVLRGSQTKELKVQVSERRSQS